MVEDPRRRRRLHVVQETRHDPRVDGLELGALDNAAEVRVAVLVGLVTIRSPLSPGGLIVDL